LKEDGRGLFKRTVPTFAAKGKENVYIYGKPRADTSGTEVYSVTNLLNNTVNLPLCLSTTSWRC